MCAAALSILRPSRVVFGCHNPRFGGVGSVLDVVAGEFPGCGLRWGEALRSGEAGEREEQGEEEEGAAAGRGREAGASGGEDGGGEKSDPREKASATSRVGAVFSNGGGKKDQHDNDHLSSLRTARPYATLGGVLAAEAIALLKEFYETGNPSAPRPNRPAAAAATRAARKAAAEAAAAEAAAAEAAALAAEAVAAASNGGAGELRSGV